MTKNLKHLITLILIECFLVTSLCPKWAWAGERLPSAVGRRFSPCPGSSLLRPKSAVGDEALRQAISGTSARDGGEHTVSPLVKSPQFHSSYALLGRGLPTEILGEKIEIFKGVQAVDARGYLIPHKPLTSPYTLFSQLLNKDEEPYRKTRELFASLARHHHFRFARGMKTLMRREREGRILIHVSLVDPRYTPPKEIFWEFWVTLLRSSAIRHDPELVGTSPDVFTAQLLGLLGEVGRLILMGKEKREKLKGYLLSLAQSPDFSIDVAFLRRYMETVDEIEDVFRRNFINLTRRTRQIYTNFALSLALPPLVRLLNPKGWPEEAVSEFVIPQDFRIRLATELKRLRRADEFQRLIRTIDGEGDPRVPETAVIGDIKMDARVLNLLLRRAVERDVDKIIMMGDIFGKSRGRSQEAVSPLAVYDMFLKFEKTFQGRGIYLFGPDELVFLFTMMGYPGLDEAWDSVYGGEAFLEARNKEIRHYNEEAVRQKGEDAELIPEVDLHNFRDDPRLREVAEWMKRRFYIYHLDEFGILYVNGALPGALGGKKQVSFADWDRLEELIRTTDTFKANVFHRLMDVNLSPVMAAGWKEDSQKLNLEEFLPSIQVDGEGGHEVTAIMTEAPNFNIQNMSFGNDFDDREAEGGVGVALRFIGRNGIQVDRFEDGKWVTLTEESPESFLGRVRENHKRRIKIVAENLAREDKKVLSLLTRRDISEENEILRWVKQIQNDVQRGAKISELVEEPLMRVAEEVLYIGGEMPNREDLAQVLGIEVFHGNILYNEETKEAVLLVGKEGIGRSYITWLLVGAKDPLTGRRLYPGWTLMSHELTQLFAIGGMIFGGTRPLRELRPEWRELYYLDKEGEVKKTGILPKEAVVKISRIILLTDEEITVVARSRMKELFKKGEKTLQGEKVEQILAIQEKASQIPSDVLKEALHRVHIEKFHVGVTRDIRSLRLPRIAAIIDADVGQKWWGSRWGAWFLTHFPPGSKLSQVLKELRHEREFPAAGLSKREQKVERGEGKGASDGVEKRIEEIVPVTNPLGLHARPSAKIAKVVNASKSNAAMMHLRTGDVADAKNVMELMTLAAEEGDELKVMVEGEDAEEVMEKIKAELAVEYTRDGGEKKIEETFVVTNPLGLHMRVLVDIVKVAQRFDGTQIRLINVTNERMGTADARSILSLLMLAAEQGHSVRLTVEGEDAEEAFAAVKFLITQEDDGTVRDGGRRDAVDDSDKGLTRIAEEMEKQGYVTKLVGTNIEVGTMEGFHLVMEIAHQFTFPYSEEEENSLWGGPVRQGLYFIVTELLKNIRHAENEAKESGKLLLATRTIQGEGEEFFEITSRNLRGEIDDILKAAQWGYSRFGTQSPGKGLSSIISVSLNASNGEVRIESKGKGRRFINPDWRRIRTVGEFQHILDTSRPFDSQVTVGTRITVLIPTDGWSPPAFQELEREEGSNDGGRRENNGAVFEGSFKNAYRWIKKHLAENDHVVVLPYYWAEGWEGPKKDLARYLWSGHNIFPSPDINRNAPTLIKVSQREGQKRYSFLIMESDTGTRRPKSLNGRTVVTHVTEANLALAILQYGFYGIPGRGTFWEYRPEHDEKGALPGSGDVKLVFDFPNEELVGKESYELAFSAEKMGAKLPEELRSILLESASDRRRFGKLKPFLFAEEADVLVRVPPERIDRERTLSLIRRQMGAGRLEPEMYQRFEALLDIPKPDAVRAPDGGGRRRADALESVPYVSPRERWVEQAI